MKQQVQVNPIFQTLTKIIDLKGSVWAGLFSWVMLIGLIKAVIMNGTDIPGGALGSYGTVLGTFGLTRVAAKAINGKNGHPVQEND